MPITEWLEDIASIAASGLEYALWGLVITVVVEVLARAGFLPIPIEWVQKLRGSYESKIISRVTVFIAGSVVAGVIGTVI